MDIKALLPRRHVLLQVQACDRHDLLLALAAPLLESGVLSDVARFVDDVERREEQVTTQIGPLVAIPHARSPAVRRLGMSVGLAAAPGHPFNPRSESLCRCFFLIAIPVASPAVHLPLLQHLVRFAQSPQRLDRLLTARTPGPVAAALAAFKDRA
jgi:mannitol/fructose-specific phosphotransferase system IIA component (Ntr-type)